MDKIPVEPGSLLFYIKYYVTKSGLIYSATCPIIGRVATLQRLNCYRDSTGYMNVSISTQGGTSTRVAVKVHEIVSLMFLINPKVTDEIHHYNAIRDDNHYWNLFWVSHAECRKFSACWYYYLSSSFFISKIKINILNKVSVLFNRHLYWHQKNHIYIYIYI